MTAPTTTTATTTATPQIRSDTVRPKWLVITRYELADLWFSAKGLSVLFGFTLMLAVLAYLASSSAGINLLDARESVDVVVQVSIGLGTLGALVVSADAISGERERGTLEALLVTPVVRRHVVIGKLLASSTMWLASLVVALPFVVVMADGPGVVRDAVAVLIVAGGLVGAALTALGLAVSSISMSNRVSLAASVAILLLLAAPSQLPAVKSSGALGSVLVKANPVSAGLTFANNVLVKQQSWSSQSIYLISPIVAAVALTAIAISLSSRLELGGSR
jgi:ABC-2 type transport system permease protein